MSGMGQDGIRSGKKLRRLPSVASKSTWQISRSRWVVWSGRLRRHRPIYAQGQRSGRARSSGRSIFELPPAPKIAACRTKSKSIGGSRHRPSGPDPGAMTRPRATAPNPLSCRAENPVHGDSCPTLPAVSPPKDNCDQDPLNDAQSRGCSC